MKMMFLEKRLRTQPQLNTIIINKATITEAISEISGTSACGPYGMQASFFKICAKEIIGPLELLFNKSLSEGIIPDALKRAAILPVFSSFFLFSKKLPIVVVQSVPPSVFCGNNLFCGISISQSD